MGKYIRSLLMICVPRYTLATNISVSTIERQPFSYGQEDAPKGFSIELRDIIAEQLDINSTYTMYENFANMIASVASGTVDVAVANISITAEREEYLDFSHPIYDSGLQFISKREDKVGTFLEQRHVILLLITLPILFFLLWMLHNTRRHRILRILAIVTILSSIWVLNEQWQQQGTSTIRSYQDISNERIGTLAGTTMSAFLDKKELSYITYSTFLELLVALEGGEVDLILTDAAVGIYYTQRLAPETFQLVGTIFAPDKIAFAFPEGSLLVEEVNTVLLELTEDGTYDRLKKKYFR